MGPPPFISKFDLVSESPVIQPLAPQGVVCILSTRHFYEKGKERQKIQKNALKQHFWGIDFPQVALSYECHYTPHRMPKTQNQWEPVEAELLLVFYSFHYTLLKRVKLTLIDLIFMTLLFCRVYAFLYT